MIIKQQLFLLCNEFVNNRLQTIEKIILSNKKALQSETKSSAGDKHETGRAMLQLEMEKAGKQFVEITKMKETLVKIAISESSTKAHLGSLIYTDKATYFLAISAGQLTIKNQDYFAISVISPIGKMLLGKQKNDEIVFNGNSIKILKVV